MKNNNLQWKVLTILAVLALAVFSFYPPQSKVKLGLDLQGGVHLVLRVQTDDALKLETQLTSERAREALTTANIAVGGVTADDALSFTVTGVPQPQEAEFRRIVGDLTTANFNQESGAGGQYKYTLKPNIANQLRSEAVAQAIQTIERRVNELGVAEPIVAPHGNSGDQILVQMPGVTDVARAKEIIRSTALLELKIVEQGPVASKEALGTPAGDMEVVSGVADRAAGETTAATVFYVVRKVAAVTGRDLRNARPTLDEYNAPAISFTLSQEGGRKFADITSKNIGRGLAIILDGRVQSAPTIQGRIADEGRITGSFTQQEAQDLALVLRSGALPASLTYLEERTVGPTLGADSVRAGVLASIGGLILVALFMLAYYKLAGINAVASVVINLVVLLGFMSYIDAVMTLPGIAGFILTIGMGVDSNVLIFERIKEELAAGKGARAAVAAGFDRVWITIVDTHITSLIAAGFLFQFGTGPIRGFATTLFFGLLSNVFTAVFVSRVLFDLVLSRRQGQAATVSI